MSTCERYTETGKRERERERGCLQVEDRRANERIFKFLLGSNNSPLFSPFSHLKPREEEEEEGEEEEGGKEEKEDEKIH